MLELKGGKMGGVTSPARPWATLNLSLLEGDDWQNGLLVRWCRYSPCSMFFRPADPRQVFHLRKCADLWHNQQKLAALRAATISRRATKEGE